MDVTANCSCEIHCVALYGFDLNTVHKLSSIEKRSLQSWDSNSGLLGGKHECFLCAMQPLPPHKIRSKRMIIVWLGIALNMRGGCAPVSTSSEQGGWVGGTALHFSSSCHGFDSRLFLKCCFCFYTGQLIW